jgi:type II secretory pathway pseudopilin PulG
MLTFVTQHESLTDSMHFLRSQPRDRTAALTLIETMVALSVFVIGGLGVIQVLGVINNNAAVDRALSAARILVGAKIAKVQTDTWTPTNGVVPTGCVAPIPDEALADPEDSFDFGKLMAAAPTYPVAVIGSLETGTVITGTMHHSVATFEASSGALLVTYRLVFAHRGKTYSVSQSTIRVPDQL